MKRTCKRCRALCNGINGFYCELGYRTEKEFYKEHEVGLIPLEDCLKPITYSDYFRALKFEKKRKPGEKDE